MQRFALALGLAFAVSVLPAHADDQPVGCSVSGTNILQDTNKGEVSIDCTGLSEAFGRQFADILNRILQDRLDPQVVLMKLDEVDRLPEEGAARTVDDTQRQQILKYLNGKPAGQIAIIAHPQVDDAIELAKAVATPLLMVGWQIEGQQIRRAAPKALDPVQGIAVVVRDKNAAPQAARQLKAALASARITVPLVSDPEMRPDATVLWVGRRFDALPDEAAK